MRWIAARRQEGHDAKMAMLLFHSWVIISSNEFCNQFVPSFASKVFARYKWCARDPAHRLLFRAKVRPPQKYKTRFLGAHNIVTYILACTPILFGQMATPRDAHWHACFAWNKKRVVSPKRARVACTCRVVQKIQPKPTRKRLGANHSQHVVGLILSLMEGLTLLSAF